MVSVVVGHHLRRLTNTVLQQSVLLLSLALLHGCDARIASPYDGYWLDRTGDIISCPSVCDYSKCPPSYNLVCPWGTGKDPCHCCHVCLRGEYEPCGGFFFLEGHCGRGLYCSIAHGREKREQDFKVVAYPVGECRRLETTTLPYIQGALTSSHYHPQFAVTASIQAQQLPKVEIGAHLANSPTPQPYSQHLAPGFYSKPSGFAPPSTRKPDAEIAIQLPPQVGVTRQHAYPTSSFKTGQIQPTVYPTLQTSNPRRWLTYGSGVQRGSVGGVQSAAAYSPGTILPQDYRSMVKVQPIHSPHGSSGIVQYGGGPWKLSSKFPRNESSWESLRPASRFGKTMGNVSTTATSTTSTTTISTTSTTTPVVPSSPQHDVLRFGNNGPKIRVAYNVKTGKIRVVDVVDEDENEEEYAPPVSNTIHVVGDSRSMIPELPMIPKRENDIKVVYDEALEHNGPVEYLDQYVDAAAEDGIAKEYVVVEGDDNAATAGQGYYNYYYEYQ